MPDQNLKKILTEQGKNNRFNHCYLIIAKSEQFEAAYQTVQETFKISPFDVRVLGQEAPIAIADIHSLRSTLHFKPYAGSHALLVIWAFAGLSQEVANSILKTLEDPPQTLIIVLGAQTEDSLLPTIISRCQTIYLDKSEPSIVAQEHTLSKIRQQTLGERLELAEVLANDPDLEQVVLGWHNEIAQSNFQNADVLAGLLKLSGTLQTNANRRLAIESFFVGLAG